MKKRIFVLAALAWTGLHLIACSSYNSSNNSSNNKLHTRILASQGVTSTSLFGDLTFINGENDTLARISPVSAGSAPGLMAISPTRNTLIAFDASSNSVFGVDTVTGAGTSNVRLSGPTSSMIVPTAALVGYAAVPTANVVGYSFVGGVEEMNLSNGAITTTIALTNAKTVVSDATGARLLVFNDTDSVAVVTPIVAAPPVDTSCLSGTPNSVCTIVSFGLGTKPVNAIVSGSTAYVFNCGPECGGTQAGVAVFDLNSMTITSTIPLDASTWGFLSGSTLYVAGTSPTVNDCSGETTAATTCGRLSIVDLGSSTVTSEIAITDGTHHRMDMSVNGQLFIGSHNCTNIGNVNNPSGEVRGCLTIYDTDNATVIIPPDNGDVGGFQSLTSRDVEYVAENGVLRVYDTTSNIVLVNDFLPQGEINIVGYVGDIKAIDFF